MKPIRLWQRLTTAMIIFCVGFSPMAPAYSKTKKVYTITEQDVEQTGYETRTMKIGRDSYRVVEVKNAAGRVLRQMMIGRDRQEVSFDKNADGRLDGWMLITRDATIEMKNPSRGRFQFMDVEQRLKNEKVLLKFVHNRKTGKYELYSSRRTPHRVMYQNSLVVGCTTLLGEQVHEDAKAIQSFINGGAANLESLKSDLEKNLLDKSCKEGQFAESQTHILNGLMAVVGSDKSSPGNEIDRPSEKGTFLQCLRYYNLDHHALKIAAAIEEYRGAKPLRPSWKLMCTANTSTAGVLGSYSPGRLPPQIGFHKPVSDITVPRVSMTASEYYASSYGRTFFHELLHHSGITDEDAAYEIENCCSIPNNEDSFSCKSLAKRVEVQSYAQRFKGNVADRMEAIGGNYANYVDTMREVFGPATDGMLDEFDTRVGKLYEEYANKEECNDQDSTEIYGSCRDEFLDDFKKILDQSFQVESCPTIARNVYLDRKAYIGYKDTDAEKKAVLREQLLPEATDHAARVCRKLSAFAANLYLSKPGDYNELCRKVSDKPESASLWVPRSIVGWVMAIPVAHALDEKSEKEWGLNAEDRICDLGEGSDEDVESEGGGSSNPLSMHKRGTEPVGPVGEKPDADTEKPAPDWGKPVTPNNFFKRPNEGKTTDDAIDHGNSTTVVKDEIRDGEQVRLPASTQGPELVIGDNSESAKDNEKVVREHIDRSNSVLGDTKRLAEKISGAIIPRAEAASRDRYGRDGLDRDSSGRDNSGKLNSRPVAKLDVAKGGADPSLPNFDPLTGPQPKAKVVSIFIDQGGLAGQPLTGKTGSLSQHKPDGSEKGLGLNASGKKAPTSKEGDSPKGAAQGPTGGLAITAGGPAAGVSGVGSGSLKDEKKNGETELDLTFKTLLGNYAEVKKLLGRPDFVSRLIKLQIQVIDDQLRVHGSRTPKHRLIYKLETKRLEILETPGL